MNICPVCEKELISPFGDKNSPVLLLFGNPKGDEITNKETLFNGSKNPGNKEVLIQELGALGLDLKRMYSMNFFLHQKPNLTTKLARGQWAECEKFFYTQLLNIVDNKKVIMLFGADVTKKLTGKGVSGVSSLQVKINFLGNDKIILASVSPGIALNKSFGEIRLAVLRLKQILVKNELWK